MYCLVSSSFIYIVKHIFILLKISYYYFLLTILLNKGGGVATSTTAAISASTSTTTTTTALAGGRVAASTGGSIAAGECTIFDYNNVNSYICSHHMLISYIHSEDSSSRHWGRYFGSCSIIKYNDNCKYSQWFSSGRTSTN